MLAMRENADQAGSSSGFDPIAFEVGDLDAWATHLDTHNVAHTPVVPAMAVWVIAADDPDGTRIILYCDTQQQATNSSRND